MKTRQPDPALELASRIYAHREDGESWTDAVNRYARDVLLRHPRTVHRWLSGESPVPAVVADSFSHTNDCPDDAVVDNHCEYCGEYENECICCDDPAPPGGQSDDDHLAHLMSEARKLK